MRYRKIDTDNERERGIEKKIDRDNEREREG